jgi:hypothetical protein
MAIEATTNAGYDAFWWDYQCRAPEAGPLLDNNVYCMSDVIRGSARVVVMVPDKELHHKQEWGMSMWTLPGGLLAPSNSYFPHTQCYTDRL